MKNYYTLIPNNWKPESINIHDQASFYASIQRRIHEKVDDYGNYNFTSLQSQALNIFFDLAQEFDSTDKFFTISVSIPKIIYSLDCTFYIADVNNEFQVVRSSVDIADDNGISIDFSKLSKPEFHNNNFYLPIKANSNLLQQLPSNLENGIIGGIVLHCASNLTSHERLFWEKYVNRIGFQLHNRFIKNKNQEHIAFIRNLVADIGHNVIVPNMYFKLFFNRLNGKIQGLKQLSDELKADAETDPENQKLYAKLQSKIDYFYDGLYIQFNEIYRHYEQTSLFLETLLRRSHFEEGHYVLEKRQCDLSKDIIHPQLERYIGRFAENDIEIDLSMGGIPEPCSTVTVDVGLLSQVYANFFSNAVKYTRPVYTHGQKRKFVAFGYEFLPKFFPHADGIKLNVFSSGEPISETDQQHLFEQGFRAGNVEKEYGTGHGLFFVRQVVELHGGKIGYEPRDDGNNFYIILPLA